MYAYYMNVPLNEKGIWELENYDEKAENVQTFELNEEQFIALRKRNSLFDEIDKAFGTIIDMCEEEVIENCQLDEAISIVTNFMKKHKGNKVEEDACNIVLESLLKAKEAGTYWEIDIFILI